MARIDTGLGWSAKDDYLVYLHGADLGSVQATDESGPRDFYKEIDGYAVGVFGHKAYYGSGVTSRYTGPILISTDPDYVKYYYGNTHLVYDTTVTYAGLVWYVNNLHHLPESQLADYDNGTLKYWSAEYSPVERLALAILNAAGVRKTSTRKQSFLSGLACGLFSETWPALEV